jgi:hypothetical protein
VERSIFLDRNLLGLSDRVVGTDDLDELATSSGSAFGHDDPVVRSVFVS